MTAAEITAEKKRLQGLLAKRDGKPGYSKNVVAIKARLDELSKEPPPNAETMHFDDLPARIHSGPVKFGHDYTGVFTRGDNCGDMAKFLKMTAKALEERAAGDRVVLALAERARTEATGFEAAYEA